MPNLKLAPDGRALLAEKLDTSEKLEIVHALWIAERPMSGSELAAARRLTLDMVHQVLGSLTEAAVVEATEHGTRFRVSASARGSGVGALMAVYEEDRSIVLAALTELALERIRNMAAEAFADALARRERGD